MEPIWATKQFAACGLGVNSVTLGKTSLNESDNRNNDDPGQSILKECFIRHSRAGG
jgi:hypothetical protein